MRLKAIFPLAAALTLAGCFGGSAPSHLLTLTPTDSRPPSTPSRT